jgi:hypothetical protein
MRRLRTVKRSVSTLVALFLVAQVAGIVPSPLAQTHAVPIAASESAPHHHHADGHRHDGCAHSHAGTCSDRADYCCALHAFFAGILSPAAVVRHDNAAGQVLAPGVDDVVAGLDPDRLDRPPRPRP